MSPLIQVWGLFLVFVGCEGVVNVGLNAEVVNLDKLVELTCGPSELYLPFIDAYKTLGERKKKVSYIKE